MWGLAQAMTGLTCKYIKTKFEPLAIYQELSEVKLYYFKYITYISPTPFNSAPAGLEDVSKYPQLFSTLMASGMWTLDDLKKLAGLNFLRVFREVERVCLFIRDITRFLIKYLS